MMAGYLTRPPGQVIRLPKRTKTVTTTGAMRLIMALADDANPFVEQAEPWNLKKDPAKADQLQDVCTVAINLFRQLVIYLTPVLPELTDKTAVLLGHPITHWDQSQTPLLGTKVAKFKHMMQRVDQKDIDKMVDDTREEQARELADGVPSECTKPVP